MHLPKSSLALILVASLACAGTPKKFGKELSIKEPTKISDILADPEKYDGKRVLVEGKVTEVCQHAGCWIKVSSDKGDESLRVKVEDGVIVFPKSAKGKAARAEGIVSVKKMSRDEAADDEEHLAKEAGKQFDPSTVKGPRVAVQIDCDGAVLK